jgi:hypothetical protein
MATPQNTAPRKIHFIQISAQRRELPITAYIAMKSAKLRNPEFDVFLHSNSQPIGRYWDLVKDYVNFETIVPPVSIHGTHIRRIEHKVDILRLLILDEHGGIYLDLDTVCLKSLAGFCQSVVVMGREDENGLCNAFIAAPPNSEFIKIWLDGYRNFHNQQWNHFSVKLPNRLGNAYPHLIAIEPPSTFFVPGPSSDSLEDLFLRVRSFPEAHIYHLWASLSKKHIGKIDRDSIFELDTTYNLAAREVVGKDRDRI